MNPTSALESNLQLIAFLTSGANSVQHTPIPSSWLRPDYRERTNVSESSIDCYSSQLQRKRKTSQNDVSDIPFLVQHVSKWQKRGNIVIEQESPMIYTNSRKRKAEQSLDGHVHNWHKCGQMESSFYMDDIDDPDMTDLLNEFTFL
jgi:hypothetical protein